MRDYTKLDALIKAFIKREKKTNYVVTFAMIRADPDIGDEAAAMYLIDPTSDPLPNGIDRMVDGRLQSMRKAGVLRYERRFGWQTTR